MWAEEVAFVTGQRTVVLRLKCDWTFDTRKLEIVFHVPLFKYSLISVNVFGSNGDIVSFSKSRCGVLKKVNLFATGELNDS